jgi:hypothetical protein
MTAVVRRFAPGVPFGEGLEVSDKMMTSNQRDALAQFAGRLTGCLSPPAGCKC